MRAKIYCKFYCMKKQKHFCCKYCKDFNEHTCEAECHVLISGEISSCKYLLSKEELIIEQL